MVQGLTLAPLVRALKVGSEVDSAKEVAELRRRAAAAALDDVRNPAHGQGSEYDVPDTVTGAVTSLYEGYLAAQDALGEARTADDEGGDYSRDLELLLRRASEIERDVVVQARRRGDVSPETADTVLQDMEARSVRDLS